MAGSDAGAWRGINGYRPRPQFLEFHKRKQRWAVMVAHRRAGKTVACVADLVIGAITSTKVDGRFAYVAPQFNQAKDVAWVYVKRLTADIPGVTYNESELRANLPNGAQVRLYGADNPDRLRGLYLDGVILDEYADMKPRVWGEVIRPMLADRRGWAAFIGTPKGKNEFWEIWSAADGGWFTLKLKASESGLLPAPEVADARASMSEDQFEQEFECSFEAAITGAFYGRELAEAASRIKHVPYDPKLPVFTAWDLGLTDDTAIWFFQVHAGEVRLIDYYADHGKPVAFYAGVVKERGYTYGRHWLPHDAIPETLAANGRSIFQQLTGLGLKCAIVPRLEINDGIQAVRLVLPRCYFDKDKCAEPLEALRQYQREWDEDHKRFKDKPRHDWCFTGDTEVLTRYGMRQIMNLPEQGEVLTPCGWKQYINPRITRRSAPLVGVRFTSGHSVRCTPDHSFLTESGWRFARDLTPGLRIQSTLTPSLSILMAAYTVVGRAIDIGRGAARSCTGMFGRLHSALYRAAVTFTTATGIPTTISSPILNASTAQNTSARPGTNKSATSIFRSGRDSPPQTGTGLTPEGFGTSDTPSDLRAGRNGSARTRLATVAARFLRRLSELAIRKGSALTTARPLTIESVERLSDTSDVWCLTVPGEECFSLGNGAVVHNCSHAADSFRYLSLVWKNPAEEKQPEKMKLPQEYTMNDWIKASEQKDTTRRRI